MDKKIILLADDDRDDIEMFCEALEAVNEDIICLCTVNGDQAWHLLKEMNEKPQLIFLDINMPIANGWECLKLIKNDSQYEDIPVIMISTSSHRNDMDKASNLGSLGYFVKPNDFNDLKHSLKVITSNLGTDLKDAIINLQSSGSKYVFHL